MNGVSTGAVVWDRMRDTFKSERVLPHNFIVGAGTMTAGLLGVAFQAFVSHRLSPADYGGLFAVVTLITFVGLPSTAFTLLMARATSRDRASGQNAASSVLLRQGNRALMLGGFALAGVMGIVAVPLGGFLNFSPWLLIAAALGFPFGLALPLFLGELQGEQRFAALSLLVVGQAALKLVGAVGLGAFLGPVGIVLGISLATGAIYVSARWILRRKLALKACLPWWRASASYLAVIIPSTLVLGALLSTDVLIVKHYFGSRAAGEYAAVAALGRAIFWGASGVATVVFPKLVFRDTQGSSGSHLVTGSLVLVAVGGLVGLLFLSAESRWLLTAFAGGAYVDAAGYLPWYALGMTMLGAVAVLIAWFQSQGHSNFLAVLVPLALVEPALLITMHRTLLQVVQVLDLSMAIILIGLGVFYVIKERGRPFASGASDLATSNQRLPDLVSSL